MTISSPGVGSSLDVNSIIQGLMSAEQGPLNILTKKVSDYQTTISAYGSLKGALSTFQTAVGNLSDASNFNAQSAQSSDSTVFTATANGNAVAGGYALKVTTLAQSQKIVSSGFASPSTVVGTGTLTISLGQYDAGTNKFTANASKLPSSITITPSNSSLGGIRDAINAANIGVTATIVNDGTANGNRLVLTSKDSGTANTVKIAVTDGDGINTDASGLSQLAYDPTLASGAGKNLSEQQVAKDAVFSIDGIQITKPSNTITDALDGVTINLLKDSAGASVNLSVTQNTTIVTSSVASFVKAFNDLNTTIRNLTNYDANSKTGGPLLGDATTLSITSQLRSIMTHGIGRSGALTTLSQIGVSFQKDGTLALDNSKLTTALNSNFQDIASLFSVSGHTTDAQVSYINNSTKTKPGSYAIDVSAAATQGNVLGAAAPNLNIVQGVNDNLAVSINGRAYNVTLTAGNYASAQDLADELQQRITTAGASAQVSVQGGALQLTSADYGPASTVAVTGGNAASDLFGNSPIATSGTNIVGTINGAPAVGHGQSLIGAAGDASEGIILQVTGTTTGSRGSVSYTMGYAASLNSLAQNLLDSEGPIASRTDGINSSITRLQKDEDAENARLAALQKQYQAQYTALDVMLSNMQSTSSFLTQQLAQINAIGK